ncbi:MAG: hypothetical protein DRN49_03595 [Thaumarchaeota archaeon]|nr:MAG: hypothetical protein DRN49_03595 [Nitrososphaerota archaeon]
MTWEEELENILSKVPRNGEIIFLGVGNPLRGDDGIGVKIAEDLKTSIENKENKIKVIVVEDRIDLIPSFLAGMKPALIIMFDAMDFGGRMGEIRITSLPEADKTISTHSLPLELMLKLAGITAPTYVVGIQISSMEFGETITPQVLEAGKKIVQTILGKIGEK